MKQISESGKIAVFGAGGFLGSNMVRYLQASGYEVVPCYRNPPPVTLTVSPMVGDFHDAAFLDRVCREVDIVFHFAQSTNPTTNPYDLKAEFKEVVNPLFELIEACVRNRVKKLVYPSSGGTVYDAGASSVEKTTQVYSEDSSLNPKTPYALAKVASENVLQYAARSTALSTAIFRIGNPYGHIQKAEGGQGVIAYWVEALKRGEPLKIFGSTDASRDFIFIDDACALMAREIALPDSSCLFNLGTGQPTSLSTILLTLERLTGKKPHRIHLPGRGTDADPYCLSMENYFKERDDFQFTRLASGLKSTLAINELEP